MMTTTNTDVIFPVSRRTFCLSLAAVPFLGAVQAEAAADTDLAAGFAAPPTSARPHVLWMWMGSNITASGLTRDLEAMRDGGIGGATIMALADVCMPWPSTILNTPTPEIVAFTDPWWALLRHAALEAKRTGITLALHNCPGYESSGGPWVPPELSMQELIWATLPVPGGRRFRGVLPRKTVAPYSQANHPKIFIPQLGRIDVPVVEARKTFYRDVALIAVPATGTIAFDQVHDISAQMDADGRIDWTAPPGDWLLYRFGHTTTGAMTQPAQFAATGLECDKMNPAAVRFHIDHVLGEMRKHLGELVGPVVTTLYFDSYEAGHANWTPRMAQEFAARRGYALAPWLPALAGRAIASPDRTSAFKADFAKTIGNLLRDHYWAQSHDLAHAAGLDLGAEPYGGDWSISDIASSIDVLNAEFWTNANRYHPLEVDSLAKVAASRGGGILAAEAFTTGPDLAKWTATPAWLKPIGDAAFCDGVNRMVLHHFAHQPWEDTIKPGMAMGRWGVQFGRNQTWWEPGKAWLAYLSRCQYLLQRGRVVPGAEGGTVLDGDSLRTIHRRDGDIDLHFIANTAPGKPARATASFAVTGRQPELWDPVRGAIRDLPEFAVRGGRTLVPLALEPGESLFIVFRRPASTSAAAPNFPDHRAVATLDRPWTVRFDPAWGGAGAVTFDRLEDWTARAEPGIRHYSGTATYATTFDLPAGVDIRRLHLDLGVVRHLAAVTLNGKSLGVVWTAPWRVALGVAARRGRNRLEIAVTNNWANRLIGDERLPPDLVWSQADPEFPKAGRQLEALPDWLVHRTPRPEAGRRSFTTWNFFDGDSPLDPSGLIGPVRLMVEPGDAA